MNCKRKRKSSRVTCTSTYGPQAFIRENHHMTEKVLANVQCLGFCYFQWENTYTICLFTNQTMSLLWVGFSLPEAKATKYTVKYNGMYKIDKMCPSNCLNFPICEDLGRQWSRRNSVVLPFDGKRWLEEKCAFPGLKTVGFGGFLHGKFLS